MPTITRARALPVLPSAPTCPAALPIQGVTPERGGIVCRVIEKDRAKTDGLDMDPVQLAIARGEESEAGDVFLTLKENPSTVERLCCGDAIPVLNDHEVPGNRESYTYCPTWQAAKWADEHGQDKLGRPMPPEESVSHGVEEVAAHSAATADPWAAAHADLDILAPKE